MNVFVTGGAGYIGSICTEELLNADHQVTVYDNLTEGHRSAVDSRAKFVLGKPEVEGDILKAVQAARPEAIVHFAASALVGESMTNPGKYFRNNVCNGLTLLEAAVAISLAVTVALLRQSVEIAATRKLDRLQIHLGRGAPDDDRKMVGRAGGSAESADFFVEELQQ